MFKAFKKLFIQVVDMSVPENLFRIINQLQSNIDDSLSPLTSNIQNDSFIVKNVSLISGQITRVNHQLDRKLAGWKIVRQRGSAIIWDSQDTNLSPNLTLWLNTSANVIVDLEVF